MRPSRALAACAPARPLLAVLCLAASFVTPADGHVFQIFHPRHRDRVLLKDVTAQGVGEAILGHCILSAVSTMPGTWAVFEQGRLWIEGLVHLSDPLRPDFPVLHLKSGLVVIFEHLEDFHKAEVDFGRLFTLLLGPLVFLGARYTFKQVYSVVQVLEAAWPDFIDGDMGTKPLVSYVDSNFASALQQHVNGLSEHDLKTLSGDSTASPVEVAALKKRIIAHVRASFASAVAGSVRFANLRSILTLFLEKTDDAFLGHNLDVGAAGAGAADSPERTFSEIRDLADTPRLTFLADPGFLLLSTFEEKRWRAQLPASTLLHGFEIDIFSGAGCAPRAVDEGAEPFTATYEPIGALPFACDGCRLVNCCTHHSSTSLASTD